MSPRSDFHGHSDDEGHHASHGPGAGNAAVAAHAILGSNGSGNPFASEYTPSTSPVLGPLRGMSLRNPSRPTSPVHLPSLRYPAAPGGSTSGTRSAHQSPTHSPDFASASDPHYQSIAANLGQQLQHSLAGHHPAYGTGGHSSLSHSHRSSHRSQPYATSRQSSRHASPVDFGGGLSMTSGAGGGHSGTNSGRSSGPPSATGTASHPPTPGPGDYSGSSYTGVNEKGLPPPSGMSLPPISSSAGGASYFPSHHYSGTGSQPGSRAHTPPPLSPDREEAFAVPHQPASPQRHATAGHHFSMTPISLGHTYGSAVAKSTSPPMGQR
jgi:zinc finger protein CreA/MIG